jgi:hypothetical protein
VAHGECRWKQKITTVRLLRPQDIERICWISGNISAGMTGFGAFFSYVSLINCEHSTGIQWMLAATITDQRAASRKPVVGGADKL